MKYGAEREIVQPFFILSETTMTITEQLSALSSILARGDLHSLFQPIVSLSEHRILGYEALTRGPSNSALHSPLNLFAIARQAGRLSELELSCRDSACRRFSQQKLPGKLFLNVSPNRCSKPLTLRAGPWKCCVATRSRPRT